ncbi:MPN domain-containing protein [Acipenser ruthenus]|uniref:MPN domain-containing protein n=1 Tax=Acipenser ruthenus TaxID=7906 RepID=A0A444UWJ2_ACIRT|nr:MPN domain-containing protein [Acipenser ruthenus]
MSQSGPLHQQPGLSRCFVSRSEFPALLAGFLFSLCSVSLGVQSIRHPVTELRFRASQSGDGAHRRWGLVVWEGHAQGPRLLLLIGAPGAETYLRTCTGSEPALEEEDLSPAEDPDADPLGGRVPAGRGAVLTRRGITLRVLLKDGLIEPGDSVLSIHYLGKRFVGDLLCDGKIRWVETGQLFNSPSAWATHCKKLINPAKKSGCGWASVKYRGQKLVQYKTSWLHKYQPAAETPLCLALQGLVSEGEEEELGEEEEEEEEGSRKTGSKSQLEPESSPPEKRGERKECVPVRYHTLGSRDSGRDPHTLVELTAFSAINRFQPFNVAMSSNVLLLLICQNLFMRGLSLVGWYHSHPFSPPHPSLQDIDSQMDYQLKLQGSSNGFQPCLGLLCGPYSLGNQGLQSKITPFCVVPPPEQRPNDYGIPVEVEVSSVQDAFLTSDVLHEMMLLVEFYKWAPDLVCFTEPWNQEITFLDKLKGSLNGHAPKDQAYSQILEYVYNQLLTGQG